MWRRHAVPSVEARKKNRRAADLSCSNQLLTPSLLHLTEPNLEMEGGALSGSSRPPSESRHTIIFLWGTV